MYSRKGSFFTYKFLNNGMGAKGNFFTAAGLVGQREKMGLHVNVDDRLVKVKACQENVIAGWQQFVNRV